MHDINVGDILNAAFHLKGIIRHTPTDNTVLLSDLCKANVRIKQENLQITGSFKLRGAANVIANLSEIKRKAGIVAPTAGNHGMGLAYAGGALGIPVVICLPHSADPSKVAFMQERGAVVQFFPDIEAARLAALELAANENMEFVSAYNHPKMIAGGGTVGLEILSDWPDVEIIIVPIGGGGLAAGIATLVKAIKPTIEIWGIQSEVSPTFLRWKEEGCTCPVEIADSIAEGISGFIEPQTITWPLVRDRVDRILSVSEVEIKSAIRTILKSERHVIEPSAAAAVAGCIRYASDLRGRNTAIILTGRNVGDKRYCQLLA